MRGQSFRSRLILGAVIWIVAGVVVGAVVLSSLFRTLVTEQFDHDLSDHTAELTASLDIDPTALLLNQRPLSDPRFKPLASGVYWQARVGADRVLRSPSLAENDLPMRGESIASPREVAGPTGPMRLLETRAELPHQGVDVAIGVGVDQRLIDEAVSHFDRTLVLSLGAIGLGLIGAAFAQVAFGLRPLKRLRGDLTRLRQGLAPRLTDDVPLEVAPLVHDLNALIDANREMVQRARAQAGNLAHALKTPLALLSEQGRELEMAGNVKAARLITEQCGRMQRQIDYQMARARALARNTPGQAANVAEQAGAIVSALSRLSAYTHVTFDLACDPRLLVACEKDDLSEMLGNLIDNAAKWAKSKVAIVVESAGAVVRITIGDDGPGVPEEARERIFKVGERLDEQKPGSGLGLAITRDLAMLYGGSIAVGASALGGAELVLTLPFVSG